MSSKTLSFLQGTRKERHKLFNVDMIYAPKNLQEALKLYNENEDAVIIGGGNATLPQLVCGVGYAGVVISIADIAELRCIYLDNKENLVIGCATTFTDLLESPLIKNHIPALADSVRNVGTIAFRNTATVGGNLCKNNTIREITACLCAYEALFQVNRGGENILIQIHDLYNERGELKLKDKDLVTAIVIEKASLDGIFGSSLYYLSHNNSQKPLMCCSSNLRLTADGMRIERLRLSFVSKGHPPRRLSEAEILAEGSGIFPADISPITAAILHSVFPDDGGADNHEFIVHLVREQAKSSITHSIELAKNNR